MCSGRPPLSMKFSDRTSNQSTGGCWDRMCAKCTVRRPTPMPRSGRPQRFAFTAGGCPTAVDGWRGRGHGRSRDPDPAAPRRGLEALRSYRPLQPPLPLQACLPAALSASMCALLTGTAQPPLPLHSFLPAHPAAPAAQPPMPLHSFLPLQACLAASEAQPPLPLQSFMPLQTCVSRTSALASVLGGAFFSSANTRVPAAIPATTAPIALVKCLRSMEFISLNEAHVGGTGPP